MNWFENLLFDPDSIAHIVLLYSVVIAAGSFWEKSRFSVSPWELPLCCLPALWPGISVLREIFPFLTLCRTSV